MHLIKVSIIYEVPSTHFGLNNKASSAAYAKNRLFFALPVPLLSLFTMA
jgi:hypothetical protein